MYYTLASGTVTPSTAWGNIIPSSCTNNGNGQWQSYTSTTCNVTLGTSPASPGDFVSGQDIFLSGPFEEEASVTAVGAPSGGVQSITFNTRYAWDNANGNTNAALVMQGGPGGQSIVATNTTGSWPVAYAVVGATSPTQVFSSNCISGYCNATGGIGNIIQASIASFTGVPSFGDSLIRTGNVVTMSGMGSSVFNFPVGSTIIVTGFTPSDLNGVFTVVTNSENGSAGPVANITWTQAGANETATTLGKISQSSVGITFYPSAFIIGTNNGTSGNAQLATNAVPFANGDTVVGAPTSEFQNSGLNIYIGQNTPVDGSRASQGIMVNDAGPSQLSRAYAALNNISNGVAGDMFYVVGSYANDFYFGYRPADNGAILFVQGGEPVSANAKPYNIFVDAAAGATFGYNPGASTFSLNQSLTVPSIAAMGSASAFAAGSTVGGILPCLQNGTDCPAGGSGGGTGTVTSVAAGTWPSWLTPTVTNATTTPIVTVAASSIPNAALANSATTVNGQTCALGGTCTITATPPVDIKYYSAAVCDGGTAYASGATRYDNQQPQAGCVLPASSTLGYLAFNAAPTLPQYAEATVSTPSSWTGTSLYINFYATATSGNVTWEVQTACVNANSVVGTPNFGTTVPVTTTVSSTSNGNVQTAILSNIATPGANGCPSTPTTPGLLTYRIYRAASDTASGNANLLGITLATGRSQ
jgi:hypothetical protein